MNKLILHSLTAMATCFIIGFFLGMLTSNKLTKQVKTTQIVTAEVKKQEVATVQQIQKDLTTVKKTNVEIISYSPKGKVRRREFIETNYGARTQTSAVTKFFDDVKTLSSSSTQNTTVSSYQSNWLVFANYEIPLEKTFTTFEIKRVDFGLGYRLIGNMYLNISTKSTFDCIIVGATLLF